MVPTTIGNSKQTKVRNSARGGGKGKTKAQQKQNKSKGIYSSKHVRLQQEKTANSLAKGRDRKEQEASD